jgi:Leucine-rich repeat (LRR) protein
MSSLYKMIKNNKYIVYEQDLIHKQNIDPSKAIWNDDETEQKFHDENLNTIETRLSECEKNNFIYLDLSSLNLSETPNLSQYEHFSKLKNVKYLFLNNNNLTSCDKFMSLYQNLEVLDISFNDINKINYLPENLVELSCKNNQLSVLPNHKNLKRLECSSNIMTSLNNYPKISTIICSNNKITHIQTYDKLEKILCDNNPVISIDDQQQLKYFDCSDTKIKGNISQMVNLNHLSCYNTNINDISHFKKLETINMVDCDSLKKIPYLKYLKTIVFNNKKTKQLSSRYKIFDCIESKKNTILTFILQ